MPQSRKSSDSDAPVAKAADERKRRTLESVIADLCAAEPSGRSIDPVAAARAYASERGDDDPLAWRKWLQQIRSTAIGMARKGDLIIYRKGKPADPDDFRGVYRLGLPRSE